ncbi:DNA-binding IclR family transcriptional regulator [Anaerosolibacter carboniphilus]|uniref:Glycerol operon regulatory protein n=1 Tax=Anaerosolibacter carboniphilus TaxID=1417629 RepID=A0A841KN99_9FIRM|nr:IclR family transcriptional regulator [Anaerosolibacter carboniphilus]MBB6215274.1 DNA-binding IclR family transcriptional regulator [Anaerosolibacter carboniphilus]
MAEKSSENSVRSIQRALNILLCFNWSDRELTLTEIAEKAGLAKSTISRLLTTMELEGFISKDQKTNRYKLGRNIYYLGLIAKESLDIRKISRPIMEEICQASKETVNLYLLDNRERVCFEQVESPQAIKQSVKIGERFAIWAGATGKAILAHLGELIWYEMIEDIRSLTESTIVEPDAFIAELKQVREQGYAVSVGEKDYEVGCVAGPIFDVHRKVIGCLAISGPRFRFPDNIDFYSRLVTEGAKKISNQLGYYDRSPEYME